MQYCLHVGYWFTLKCTQFLHAGGGSKAAKFTKATSLRLQAKFLAIVAPLVLVAIALVFAVVEWISANRAEEAISRKLDQILSIQSEVLADPVWNVAREQIHLVADAIMQDEDVAGLTVRDEDGDLILSQSRTSEDSALLEGRRDIKFGDGEDAEVIGTFDLALRNDRLLAERTERMIEAAALARVLVLAVIIAALVANRRIVGLPLGRLLQAIKTVEVGGARAPVSWHSRDEMGEVITAFNDMLAREENNQRSLEESRDALERAVEERTVELRRQSCEAARSKLQQFAQARSLFTLDEEGAKVYLDEDQTLAARAEVQAAVSEHCDCSHPGAAPPPH